ncbi:hypothetical protein [Telluribacter humicola]|uniref:hypothetical protein n=1 Tax=Telluribacter humicola TaxID=1720261 RepID=UPI001A967758|nr:hypothetical protein [Telluribacter humicola]
MTVIATKLRPIPAILSLVFVLLTLFILVRHCRKPKPDPIKQAADSAFIYVQKANEHRDSTQFYYEKYLRAKDLYDSHAVDNDAYKRHRDSLRSAQRARFGLDTL